MTDEPRCPKCRKTRCVVVVPNPKLGGFKNHCNGCGEEWLSEKPRHASREYYDGGGMICGEDGL